MTATVREFVGVLGRLVDELIALPFLLGLLFRTGTHSLVAVSSSKLNPVLADDYRLVPSPVAALRASDQRHRDLVARLLTAGVGGFWWVLWDATILYGPWPFWYRSLLALQAILLVADPALWVVYQATEQLQTQGD